MKRIGCLLILLVLGAIVLLVLSKPEGVDEDQAAQWVGQKAHRGWNRTKGLIRSARQGWQADRDNQAPPEGDR